MSNTLLPPSSSKESSSTTTGAPVPSISLTEPTAVEDPVSDTLYKLESLGGSSSPPGSSLSTSSAAKAAAAVRAKFALQPGFGLQDWIKRSQSGEDLSGVRGQIRGITREEVKEHRKPDSPGGVWIIFRGKVYNVSAYAPYHPGGVDQLMRGAGKDSTLLIEKVHPWVNVEAMLERCLVGILV